MLELNEFGDDLGPAKVIRVQERGLGLEERIRADAAEVLAIARQRGMVPRAAAVELAERRVRAAMATRRFRTF